MGPPRALAPVRVDARKGDVRSGRGPLRALRANYLATAAEAMAASAPALARPLARTLLAYSADAAVPLPRATAKRICRQCTHFMLRRGSGQKEQAAEEVEGDRGTEAIGLAVASTHTEAAWADVQESASPGKLYARVSRRPLTESEAANAARRDRGRRRGERRASLGPTAKVTIWVCGRCGHRNAYPESEGGGAVVALERGKSGVEGPSWPGEPSVQGAGTSGGSARKRKRKGQLGALKAHAAAAANSAPRTPSPGAGLAWLDFGTPPAAAGGHSPPPRSAGAASKRRKR